MGCVSIFASRVERTVIILAACSSKAGDREGNPGRRSDEADRGIPGIGKRTAPDRIAPAHRTGGSSVCAPLIALLRTPRATVRPTHHGWRPVLRKERGP